MSLIDLYKKMVLSLIPENLEKQLKTEKGTLGNGIKNVVLASLVVDLFVLLSMVLSMIFQLFMSGVMSITTRSDWAMAAMVTIGGFGVLTIMTLVLIPIFLVLVTLIFTALAFILCKILGGKGTFTDQYYQFSIVGSGFLIVASILNLIPIVGGLFISLLGIYYLYPVFLVYRAVHKMSNMRAALAVIIPLIVMLLVLFIGFLTMVMVQFLSPSYYS